MIKSCYYLHINDIYRVITMEDWLYRISPALRIVGNAPTQTGWVEAMRAIYEHELVMFEESSYEVEIEGEKIVCPPDSFIIVPPGRRHISRETGHRPGMRRWVHFDWNYVGDASHLPIMTYAPARPKEHLFRPAPGFVPPEILHGPLRAAGPSFELFSRIESLFNLGNGHEKTVSRGIFLELLLELLCPESEPRREEDAAVRPASKIRARLNQLADQPANRSEPIQEYLEQSGLSYAHQCRVFKQCYGISPLQYVTELRMTRIKNLLRDTDYPVSRIADMAGFESLGYFSRCFKNNAGVSPRAYRRCPDRPSK